MSLAALIWSLGGCRRQDYYFEGKKVEQVETSWGWSYGLPIPAGVESVYYGYRDASGKFVLHGPYRVFNPEGKMTFEGVYRDGKQNGPFTYWNAAGTTKELEVFWKEGTKLGSAKYASNGQLEFYNEDIYEQDRKVAHKSYSYKTGVWRLCAYGPTDWAIEPQTGKLYHSSTEKIAPCDTDKSLDGS